ncbi:hypothetical protein C8J30_10366 [Rhodobacter viridis]|uniref:tRNA A-37 threonylcarbamoyl transferase component Bud32 n=1 Tax=Rhodobacter viridis TaxID=1054202 RepID=A0A318U0D2_9RHOB|nr:hypothetical protein [Rhodobacter viridis]PYF10972.1 hypothetical protein C8J30_10366 [Rhodobacter viridis]
MSARRIEKTFVAGQPGWVKRVEQVGLRLRLQKGDPRRLFEAERSAYLSLQDAHLPFPKVLAEGPDHFVLADAGPTVRSLLRRSGSEAPDVRAALVAAARALAGLHAAGYSHGRPNLCDICWQDGQITFIDLEKYRARHNTPGGHVWDVLIFFFDLCAETGRIDASVLAARAAYRAADTKGIWEAAVRRMRQMRPFWAVLVALTRPLRHKRDFRAIGPFVALFRDPQ